MHGEDISPGNHLVTVYNPVGRPVLSKPHLDLPRESKVGQPSGFFRSCPEFNNPTFVPIRAASLITQHRYLKSLICQPTTNPPNDILHSANWTKAPDCLNNPHNPYKLQILTHPTTTSCLTTLNHTLQPFLIMNQIVTWCFAVI